MGRPTAADDLTEAPTSQPDVVSVDHGLGAAARRGVAWSAVETWTIKATGAVTFVIVSRQLQPAQFGIVALAVATIAILSLLNERGLASVLIRSLEVSESMIHTVFWVAITVAAVLTGVMWAAAGVLSDALGQPDLPSVLRWLSASFMLSALSAVPDALLRRALRFKDLALRGTAATLASSVVGIVLAVSGAGVWALVAQQLTGSVVSTVLLWALTRWRPRRKFSLTVLREMLGFAGRFTLIDVLTTVQDRGEVLIISAVSGASVLGSWTVGGRIVRIMEESGASVVNSVAIPTFARLQQDRSQLHRGYSLATTATGSVLFPGFLVLAVVSNDLVPWVLGAQWRSSGTIAQVLALAAALGLLNYFDRNVFIAIDRLRPELWIMVATVFAQLSVVLVFARYGPTVLAVAILARVALTVPMRLVMLHRWGGVPFSAMTGALRVFGAGLLAACGAWAVRQVLSGDSVLLRIVVPTVVLVLLYLPALALVARRPATTLLRQVWPSRTAGGAA